MPQVLAIDWDDAEARYACADITGRSVRVRALGSAPLSRDESDDPLADWLRTVREEQGRRHPRLVVAVQRSHVEILDLTLPPASDDELPELVANQALAGSGVVAEDALLDFVALDETPDAQRHVTAAALPREEAAGIQDRCRAVGWKPERLVLRSLAGTSLAAGLERADRVCLLVVPSGAEVSLTVLSLGTVAFSRTVRLPEQIEAADIGDRLLAEINRTRLAAPRERLGDDTIARVYVVGSGDQCATLAERIEQELELPAEVLDPFVAAQVPAIEVPARPERFVPLLGMLLDEALGRPPLDFLHPRRPARNVGRWRVALGLAAAALVLILAAGGYVGSRLSAIGRENAQLSQRLRDLKDTSRKGIDQKRRIEAVAAWQYRDVNWLDELRDLSLRFPGPRDVVVLRASLRPVAPTGGTVEIQGLVRDPKVVVNLEGQVRDEFRRIRSRRVQQRAGDEDYTWYFEASMFVEARGAEAYAASGPARPGAASAPATEEAAEPAATTAEATNEEAPPAP